MGSPLRCAAVLGARSVVNETQPSSLPTPAFTRCARAPPLPRDAQQRARWTHGQRTSRASRGRNTQWAHGRHAAAHATRGRNTRWAHGQRTSRVTRGRNTQWAHGQRTSRVMRGRNTHWTHGQRTSRASRGRNTQWAHGQRTSRVTRGRNTQWAHGQRTSLRPLRDEASRSGRGVRPAYEWRAVERAIALAKRVDRSALGSGPFVPPSPRSPRRRSWRSTMRHRLGQANALAAPRRCVAQRPEACPLAVRPLGVPAARHAACPLAVRPLGVPAARHAACPLAVRPPGVPAARHAACPLAVRPTGVPAARRMGRRVAAVRPTGVPAARRDLSSGRADLRAPVAHHVGPPSSTVFA
jgi:hypothetical protein